MKLAIKAHIPIAVLASQLFLHAIPKRKHVNKYPKR